MGGIRISARHGLNPTIPVCMFCGKDRNEIAFLGALPKDQAAPMRCVIDQEPCDECKHSMALGVALISVTETPRFKNMQPVRNNPTLYLTGEYIVVHPEDIQKIFDGYDETNIPPMGDKIFVNEDALHTILSHMTEEEN